MVLSDRASPFQTFHVLSVRHMMRKCMSSKHQCLFSKLVGRIGA